LCRQSDDPLALESPGGIREVMGEHVADVDNELGGDPVLAVEGEPAP
jgi:hypothetical protein